MNIDEARAKTVDWYIANMEAQRHEDLFASHVTKEMKELYFAKQRQLIEDIKAGKLDSNFTVWQRMNYYITGKYVPLLSK